ncbi:hypothetical protein Bbelb_235000 [Branchiostoma belcheri]|nr:hypothetical protein Bbelb_235000 [Branchiostoma belcheri]
MSWKTSGERGRDNLGLAKTTVGIATIEPGREDSAGKEGESLCVCVLIGPVHAEARTAGCDRGLNVCGLRIYHPYVRVRATRVRPRYGKVAIAQRSYVVSTYNSPLAQRTMHATAHGQTWRADHTLAPCATVR